MGVVFDDDTLVVAVVFVVDDMGFAAICDNCVRNCRSGDEDEDENVRWDGVHSQPFLSPLKKRVENLTIAIIVDCTSVTYILQYYLPEHAMIHEDLTMPWEEL